VPPLRVFLVDDNRVFLHATACLLSGEPDMDVVGRAASGEEALERLPGAGPDVVLVDWEMPGMNGLELARQLKEMPDPPRVVMLTLYDLAEYRDAAATLADGFLPKTQTATGLVELLRKLCRNGTHS
jgi:DNA-binding NarL/FixJ family response regulator